MKRFGSYLVSSFLAVAAAGCTGMQSQNGGPATPPVGTAALPPAVVRADRGTSWMLPEAKKSSALIYAGVWATNDVYVLDYSTGKVVGTLTGFDEPYGQCVDAKGDVFIANFGGGDVVEYAHGGTKVKNTYDTAGKPIGCSVNAKGDVAVTNFDPGEVTVYAEGNPSKRATYSGSSCEFLWPMGYDDKRNLIGIGEEYQGTVAACGLLPGAKSMTTFFDCCQGPITIDLPGGTMWDGKHIGLGDQEVNGTSASGIWPSTLVYGSLKSKQEVVLLPSCSSENADVVSAFIVGKKNTPLNKERAKFVVGPGSSCSGGVTLWHYPSGTPYKSFTVSAGTVYGVSVSLAP